MLSSLGLLYVCFEFRLSCCYDVFLLGADVACEFKIWLFWVRGLMVASLLAV